MECLERFIQDGELWIIGLAIYLLLTLILLLIAIKKDVSANRTIANIVSSYAESYTGYNFDIDNLDSSITYFVDVQFTDLKNELRQSKFPIEHRLLKKYTTTIPIIYYPNKPNMVTVDNKFKIYQAPIALFSVLLICILITMISCYLQ